MCPWRAAVAWGCIMLLVISGGRAMAADSIGPEKTECNWLKLSKIIKGKGKKKSVKR